VNRRSERCTVVIGAQRCLDALRERAGSNGDGEVLAFTDADTLRALETITKRKPSVITLERLFAATPRGAALITRVKADPALASVEIHITSHDGGYSRVSPRRTPRDTAASAAASAAQPPEPPLDWHGTRRAPRFRMKDNTELQVDGAVAKLVDLSAIGAQIVSKSPLRPQQRLRVTLADDLGVARFNAAVAWASFEIPKGMTRYRAGVEFEDAEPSEVEAFARRHKTK
jgi:PilZ domain-containing protein